ncbi:MAG TPA: DMSO reductase, partial [Spirochaetes bacterium]|nr:DMSO reductase [Spirochaetota bacterium]
NGGDIAGHKVKGLKTLLDEGRPENFMFHYGRLKGSDSKIVKDFLALYGTGTVGNHTSICEGGKWVAQELIWGKHYDVNDIEKTNMILNFGCNLFEAHTSHTQMNQRATNALQNGVKMYTFDIRLSNTAAKSTEWIPISPGTDLAVILAMCNVIMSEGLFDRDFIENWTTVTVDQLKNHLVQYTPKWAEGISHVPAEKIKSLAIGYAKAKPGTCVSYRGAIAHYNGVEVERANKTLDAICGYIDVEGGTNHGIGAKWKVPKVKGPKSKKLKILDGFPGDVAYPNHHVNHQVLKMIKDGSYGRPDIYLIHCYNPVYVNGECQENIDILSDENLVPFVVSADVSMSESTALADLILPDVTYLERMSWDDMVSYEMIPEFYIRQPVVKPLGETRQFQDVCIDIAKRLGFSMPYDSSLDYVRQSCEKSQVNFDNIMKHGVYHDPGAKPKYKGYMKVLDPGKYTGEDILPDKKTGTYWNWKKSSARSKEEAASKGYTDTKNAYKGYVGQRVGDTVYAGFKPDKVNKSGKIEVYSELLKKKGFDPMPTWMAVPEYEKKKANEVVLASFKVSVQTHSRTQNCKWLTEIYHDNPALINPQTAAELGLGDGNEVKIKSPTGEIITKVKFTEGVVPGLIGISFHCGHWEYGRYASGKASSEFALDKKYDPDLAHKWWDEYGMHPNWIIPNSPDPISGQWRMNDTVVTVEKV